MSRYIAWAVKWGPHYDSGFYDKLISDGMLEDRDLMPNIKGLEFYMSSFQELGTSRQISMGVGPIPFTAIVEYSKIYDVGEFEEFLYVIRKMDETYLSVVNKEVSSATNKANKNHSGNTGRKGR